jgi:hypothetical protein
MAADWLRTLERDLAADADALATAVVALAAVAGRDIRLDEAAVRAAARRSLLVLAAGGDPNRGLDLNGRAVETLARELDSRERRAALVEGLVRLRRDAAGLPHVNEAIYGMLDAPDVAWRAYACSLLAGELGEAAAD